MSKPPSISDALDRYIETIETVHEQDGRYHPSSMWLCARATILAVRGVKIENGPDTQVKRVFQIGHLMHALVQNSLEGAAGIYRFTPEIQVDVPEWNLNGHADGLLELTKFGDEWVLEIKSTKSLRYTPKDEHKKQAITYAEGLVKKGYSNIKGIILVYLEKSNMEMREFVYPRQPGWTKMVTDKIKELDNYRLSLTDDLPPPLKPEKGRPHWFLGYCQFRGSGSCCGDPVQEDLDW